MKSIFQSNGGKTLVVITVAIANFNLIPTAIAKPPANTTATQARRCTPKTCTPYRANYERAIARGIITRPSPVANENEAIAKADQAIAKGDRNEAARRLAQALVILSEKQGTNSAVAFERTLEADTKAKKGQTLRQFLPLYGRIFPLNQNPYQ